MLILYYARIFSKLHTYTSYNIHLFSDASECCTRMCRVIRAIQEYINECDRRFSAERQILPMYRSGRGRQCTIIVRFNFQTGQRQLDDIELFSHFNEALYSLRAAIQRRYLIFWLPHTYVMPFVVQIKHIVLISG